MVSEQPYAGSAEGRGQRDAFRDQVVQGNVEFVEDRVALNAVIVPAQALSHARDVLRKMAAWE